MKSRGLISAVFILIALSACHKTHTDNGSFYLDTKVDTTAGTIGDVFNLTVTAHHLNQRLLQVQPPAVPDSLTLAYFKPSLQEGDSLTIHYGIAVWDTGEIQLPTISVKLVNPDSSVALTMNSQSMAVTISSVLNPVQDKDLQPIKAPVPLRTRIPFREIILWSIILILLIAAIYTWRKRVIKKDFNIQKQEYTLPADKVAFQRLLEVEGLLETDISTFYVKLSYLLREYLEHSFYFKTLEMTAGEIREISGDLPISPDLLAPVLTMLERADYIKFAKRVPRFEEGKADLKIAEEFVRGTIPLWKIDQTELVSHA